MGVKHDNLERDELRKLEAAIVNLPRLQREILLARRLDDLTYKEIAFLTGLSERYIERQMARAIAKVCKQLDGQELRWWERIF